MKNDAPWAFNIQVPLNAWTHQNKQSNFLHLQQLKQEKKNNLNSYSITPLNPGPPFRTDKIDIVNEIEYSESVHSNNIIAIDLWCHNQ